MRALAILETISYQYNHRAIVFIEFLALALCVHHSGHWKPVLWANSLYIIVMKRRTVNESYKSKWKRNWMDS
jgi:hypothetical protein